MTQEHIRPCASINMDNLPNEILHMVASHLATKDIASFRRASKRYEAVGVEQLFSTLKFTFGGPLKRPAVVRHKIAKHVKRVHIDNWATNESDYDGPRIFGKIIRGFANAGADITELRLRIGWDEHGEAMDRYATILRDTAWLMPNLARLNINHSREYGACTDNGQSSIIGFRNLYTAIASLEKLEVVDLVITFDTIKTMMWELVLPYYGCTNPQNLDIKQLRGQDLGPCSCYESRWPTWPGNDD